MGEGIYARALHRAAALLGGKDKLREYLRVSMRELDAWMAGTEKPPMAIFLRAVDVISDTPAEAAQRASQRSRVALARERAQAIHKAILERRTTALLRPVSALSFLETKFEPSEGHAMVEAALEAAIGATGADMGNVQLACPEGLRIVAHRGFEQPFLDFFAVVDEGSAASCGAAKKSGKRVVVTDVASDPIFAGTPAEQVMAAAGVRSVQSTPLVGQTGTLHGMLSTHCASPRDFSAREQDVLDHIARRAAFWLDGGAI